MKLNTILVGMTMTLLLLILPAAASDYTLGIFGNANEDDTINMQDVTYTELIILEYRDRTELADAKYDGKINMQDVTQIELVILGKEKELTLIDYDGDAVTVRKPVNRIIPMSTKSAELLQALDGGSRVVGVTGTIADDPIFYPEFDELPTVGSWGNPDYEQIITLNPDLVIGYKSKAEELKEKIPDSITVLRLDCNTPGILSEDMLKLGYILDSRDTAEEFNDWYEGHLNAIKDRTEGVSGDEKERVYIESMNPYMTSITKGTLLCEMAGGINIAADLPGSTSNVDKEWVVEQNPDVIIKLSWWGKEESGYEVDDPSGITAMRDEIMSRPELANVAAVKDGRVYVIAAEIWGSPHFFVGVAYQAKFFQPDLLEDLNPETIHQEYLTEFQGLDYDLNEHGILAYPPIEIDGGLAGIPDRYRE